MAQFATAEAAEAAFYHAFTSADHAAMMNVWHDAPYVECVHPGGPRLRSREIISRSWRDMFAQPIRYIVRLEMLNRIEAQGIAIHVLTECITVQGRTTLEARINATNAYQYTAQGWRMILHHASPIGRDTHTPPSRPGSSLH
jgi:ketosteroid isomerase-like protein